MEIAIKIASSVQNDVPVGAVIVKDNEIISIASNNKEHTHDITAHAEIVAIKKAEEFLHNWRLDDCDLYVTLEPCPMCAAALNWAQVGRIVYGAPDPRRGCTLYTPSLLHPRTEVVSGVLADDCSALMRDYFKTIRK